MNPINVDVLYRPVRIGWCIRSGDLQGYRKALTLTHTLWGGKFNPIIAIDDFELACSLIKTFRVDLLFPISEDTETYKFIEKFAYISNPLLSDRLFDTLGNGLKTPRFVDISHSIYKFYENEYKSYATPKYQIFLYDWEINDPLADVFLAKFGKVPSKEETGHDYCAILENDLHAKPFLLTFQDPVPAYQDNCLALGSFSELFLRNDLSVSNRHYSQGFYIGNANDFHDLVNYWNLQAAGTSLTFYDCSYSERFEHIQKKHLTMFNNTIQSGKSNTLEIWHRKANALPDLSHWGNIRSHGLTNADWNNRISQASYIFYSKESTLGTLSKYVTGNTKLSLPLHASPFLDSSDPGQLSVISIQPGSNLFNNSDETTFFPFIPELNHVYGTNCTFEIGRTRVEPKGLGIITEINRSEISLNLANVKDLIFNIFSIHNISSLLSTPGKVAKQLIKQMGGLQGCRPLKIEGVRKLIKKYKPHEHFDWGEGTNLIYNNGAYSKENTFFEGEKLSTQELFKHLLKKGVFSAGLSFCCPICNLEFWIAIDDIKKLATCEFCSHQFNVTPYLKEFGSWQFRRSGLFGGYDDQYGAIPVVLTLQLLDQALGFEKLIYVTSTELKGKNIQKCESDFIAISSKMNREQKIEIIISECKSHLGEITHDDVVKLKSLVDSFPIDKFAVYVVFSKLGPFSSSELASICHLNQSMPRVIIFTPRELECSMMLSSNLYEDLRRELRLGSLRSGNLKEIAAITQQYILLNHSQGYPASTPSIKDI